MLESAQGARLTLQGRTAEAKALLVNPAQALPKLGEEHLKAAMVVESRADLGTKVHHGTMGISSNRRFGEDNRPVIFQG